MLTSRTSQCGCSTAEPITKGVRVATQKSDEQGSSRKAVPGISRKNLTKESQQHWRTSLLTTLCLSGSNWKLLPGKWRTHNGQGISRQMHCSSMSGKQRTPTFCNGCRDSPFTCAERNSTDAVSHGSGYRSVQRRTFAQRSIIFSDGTR